MHVSKQACASTHGVLDNTRKKIRFMCSKVKSNKLASYSWNRLALVGETTKEYLQLALSHTSRAALGII